MGQLQSPTREHPLPFSIARRGIPGAPKRKAEAQADSSQNSVGSKELERKLLMTAMCQRGLDIRLKLQINHITRLELTFRTMFVSLLLHPLFGTIQVLTNNVSHQLTIRQPGLQISDISDNQDSKSVTG
jgi:hypothetical protein